MKVEMYSKWRLEPPPITRKKNSRGQMSNCRLKVIEC